jgi:hypothetical protein
MNQTATDSAESVSAAEKVCAPANRMRGCIEDLVDVISGFKRALGVPASLP